ncbi:MAG: argininosuccinate lyase [Victivallales bacterium]|nr:argininosuccinate lyase [Victivallales bacterium]
MAKKLWGGRFKKTMDKEFERFSKSIQYDYKLARIDVFHSIIHTRVLNGSGILTNQETAKIMVALDEILREIDGGTFRPNPESEDIHTDVHNRLEKKVGALALKVHTMRSRNDQIVFNEKFYCLDEALNLKKLLSSVLDSFLFLMKKYQNQPFVGYTHTQRAQVILFSDYIIAFGRMVVRDYNRVDQFYDSLVPYIGAGALAGSSLDRKDYDKAIDDFCRMVVTKHCKPKAVENSLDNVSDRDFMVEFLGIISIIQMHLSRLAEDFILYSTQEFNYIDLPEEFCTGSSLMPHKKNPDFLELVRGYTGRIYGNQIALLTTMKGLPMTYNRDMQLDKEPLFSSVEIIKDELSIMTRFLKGVTLNTAVIEEALKDETLYATELAESLVLRGTAFKDAHDIVGKLIRYSKDKNMRISKIPDDVLRSFHAQLNQQTVRSVMHAAHAVTSKKSINRKVPKIHA